MEGKNIFLDFEIILKSLPAKLKKELDVIIQLNKDIYIWSKKYTTKEMQEYCKSIKFENEEKEEHKKVIELRKESKTYEEIKNQLNIPIWKIGFYLSTDIKEHWELDDWIKDYMIKDSSIFQKVDFIVDPDKKLVDRFKSRGIDGNCLSEIR